MLVLTYVLIGASDYLRNQQPRALGLQYKQMYKESIEEPEKFWGEVAEDLHWEQKVRVKA